MDLKTILNQVLAQSGFLERGSFTGSSDPDDKQMIAIANRVAYEIGNFFPWPALQNGFKITTITDQFRYKLPDDFQSLVPDSAWETDGNRRVEFPTPMRRWFMYKYTTWSDGGTMRVRLYDGEIEIHDIEGGESFNFEYISKWLVKSSEGVRKPLFTLDNDAWILDDQLLILGVQAHWQQAKVMPTYQEHFANYHQKMAEAIGRVSGGRTIGGAGRAGNERGAPYYPLYRPAI